MKPFDLKAALTKAKLVTRDGQEVLDFHYFRLCKERHNCRAVIEGTLHAFTEDGYAFASDDMTCSLDLFLKD